MRANLRALETRFAGGVRQEFQSVRMEGRTMGGGMMLLRPTVFLFSQGGEGKTLVSPKYCSLLYFSKLTNSFRRSLLAAVK